MTLQQNECIQTYTFCNLLLPPSECSKINVQKNVFLNEYMVNALHNNDDGETYSNLLMLMDRIHYIVCTHPRFLCIYIYILFSCDPHKIMKMCTMNKPGRMSSCKMSKMYKDREANVYIPRQNKNLYNFCYIIYHERGKKRF